MTLSLSGLVGPASAERGEPPAPEVALRADHMVLDAAIRGDRVLVATQSGRIEAYDWRQGERLAVLLSLEPEGGQELPPTVSCVALSPAGRRAAAASSDQRLWLFDPEDPTPGLLQPRRTPSQVLTCRFLDEGRLLLGSLRGELALLDIDEGREIYRRQLDYDPVYAIAVSPDGRRVAVALRSSRIQIVDGNTGETLQVLEGHRDSVFGLCWASDSALVSGSKDKRALVWDLATEPARPRTLHQGDRHVTALAFDPAGARLAVTLEEHRIGLIGLEGGQLLRQLAGHTAPIQALAFVEGGRGLVSAGNDARVLVWNVEDPVGGNEP